MSNFPNAFDHQALLACSEGRLFGPGNAQLPAPPMLMFDSIPEIRGDGGAFGRGLARAELQVTPDLWFFGCHFQGDPVMPGCLGLDALWQLLGFFLAWTGAPGRGRALSAGEVKFTGQVLPNAERVAYRLDVKRVFRRSFALGIADGEVAVDDKTVYRTKDLRVGLFENPGEQIAG